MTFPPDIPDVVPRVIAAANYTPMVARKPTLLLLHGTGGNEHDLIERMTRHWSRGMQWLGAGEIVLDGPVLVLKPGPADETP